MKISAHGMTLDTKMNLIRAQLKVLAKKTGFKMKEHGDSKHMVIRNGYIQGHESKANDEVDILLMMLCDEDIKEVSTQYDIREFKSRVGALKDGVQDRTHAIDIPFENKTVIRLLLSLNNVIGNKCVKLAINVIDYDKIKM